MKNIVYYIAIATVLLFASCASELDTEPSGSQVSDVYKRQVGTSRVSKSMRPCRTPATITNMYTAGFITTLRRIIGGLSLIHISVSQHLLEKDLERFGELFGDVRTGDVLHPTGFDELPEVKLRGLRLAVGGGGIDLLGADPEPFAFHLSGLQEVCLLYTSYNEFLSFASKF